MIQAQLLAAGIVEMGLDIDAATQTKLLQYVALLQKWNKVYNLTAVRDPLDMVTLHLLDSLSVLPYVQGSCLLDVGSGGGLPGIVLAICKPELRVTTIDAVQKKAIFMRQVKAELSLNNLRVVHARVETFKPEQLFDEVISRAFSEIGLFMSLTKHLLAKNGRWLAMKGQVPQQEFEQAGIQSAVIQPLNVAGLQAERHLIVIENK